MKVVVGILVILLVGSNVWWAYQVLDRAVTASYRETAFQEHREALSQALAVLPHAAQCATRDDVIAAARQAAGDEGFEKDGFVWIGRLGYRFDGKGRLTAIETSWSPY